MKRGVLQFEYEDETVEVPIEILGEACYCCGSELFSLEGVLICDRKIQVEDPCKYYQHGGCAEDGSCGGKDWIGRDEGKDIGWESTNAKIESVIRGKWPDLDICGIERLDLDDR